MIDNTVRHRGTRKPNPTLSCVLHKPYLERIGERRRGIAKSVIPNTNLARREACYVHVLFAILVLSKESKLNGPFMD